MQQYIDLITPERLADSLRRSLILDARPAADYASGHIPGAQPIHWEEWCEPAPAHASAELKQPGYWGVLQDAALYNVAERLAELGLENERPLVVYADEPRSKGHQARIAWMLLYWGARRVSLLDGGWNAWLASDGPIEQQRVEIEGGAFMIEPRLERRISLTELKGASAQEKLPLLVDTRSHAEFIGEQHAYQPRMGHIPGSLHWPFTTLFDQHGRFINRATYLAMLNQLIGEREDWVACCEVGVRSCVPALLHEIYTGQIIRNFDGSLMAWGLDKALEIVKS